MRKLMLLLTCLFVWVGLAVAQKHVTGVVTSSEDGEPIFGASVLVKGTTMGATTDLDGKFSLVNVSNDASSLVVSFIGMETQEVAIKSHLSIILHPNLEVLDEVVVTSYGTSTKGTFTGSASVMKADKIEKLQVSNVSNALSGAVAGVQTLNSNGQPGESSTIRVRGVGSINAGKDPLFVVDGIPFDGDLSSINTVDIESMTVLKDAASTALYGARGANGIIMITTKKGKTGKAQVTLDSKWGINSRAVKNYDVLTSAKNYLETEYQAIYNSAVIGLNYSEAAANQYANKYITTNTNGGNGYSIYTVPTGQLLIGTNGQLNPNATLGYSDGKYYYTPDNWADEMFDNKLRQEYNLNISGSGDRASYYISFGYLDDEGIIEGSGFTRFSSRANIDFKVNDWLKVGANVSYNYSESLYPDEQTNTSSSGNAFYMANYIAPIYPIYVRDASGKIMTKNGKTVYDYGTVNDTNFARSFMSISNPAADLIYNDSKYLMDIMNSSWFATITPIKNMTVTARYGLNVDNTRYNELGNAYFGQSASSGGTAYQSHSRTLGFDQQYVANYMLSLDNHNKIDITAGYDSYHFEQTLLSGYGTNLYNPNNVYLDNVIDNISISGYKNEYSTLGYFARVNYGYAERYFVNGSYRRDASSRFAEDNRWGDFFSASVAWLVTEEDFMKEYSWLNMLKFKASIGQQGNDDILFGDGSRNYYPHLDQYTVSGANGIFSDGTLSYKGNEDLTWETSTSYNIGFDFAMLSNTLTGTIEYFGRKSSDMLYNKPVAASLGYTSIPMNVGSMTNSGVEIDLNYVAFQNKTLTVNVNANATFVKNEINELHKDLGGTLIDGSRIYEEGESMYRMYLVEWAGVSEETGEALYYAKDAEGKRYATADYSIAQGYKVATDDMMPSVYGGFGISASAYGFDASIQCAYQLGGDIYDSGYQRLMHSGYSTYAGQNWHKDIYNAWTPDNVKTNVPRLNASDKYANSTSTRFLTSSNYLSLNNISVGYTVPAYWSAKMGLDKVRIYFAADNVALLSSRQGLDPRQSYISASTAVYTPIRTVSGGINVTF